MEPAAGPAQSPLMIPVRPSGVLSLIPGLIACGAVALAAVAVQALELRLFGRSWIDAIVLAILIGAAIRSVWTPPAALRPGIEFSARTLLEVAVVLLGASVSAATVIAIGPGLLGGTAVVVVLALAVSYGIGRLLRLPHRMAVLIACGNAICGNSAIAAVAPVIDADAEEVSAAIAFTAVLGVAVVLLLPLLGAALQMTGVRYGVLAGLTVYAVPQVLAATLPVGAVAAQAGTLIKLVRVLMLGPVCLGLAILTAYGSTTIDRLSTEVYATPEAYLAYIPEALRDRPLRDPLVVQALESWASREAASIMVGLFLVAGVVTVVAIGPALALGGGRSTGRVAKRDRTGMLSADGPQDPALPD